jgi:sulfate/thiosulfate transport system permease protein
VASSQSTMVGAGSPVLKWVLRAAVVGYLFFLVGWPSALIVRRTFEGGTQAFTDALQDPDVTHALKLSVIIALFAVVINLLFGVGMSLLLVRFEFPGKRALSALIDLPLAVSPIVVGLALVLVYNPRYGWFGEGLDAHGIQIIFAKPGMVMATTFVALPLVIREVVPVLEDMGDDQEQAANSLGANAWQTFWRITLPGIKWAVVYGVVLSLARSLGEFGAVKVVAGNVSGETTTAPVLVQQKYQNFEQQTAYTVSFLLVAAAVVCLIVVALLRPKDHKPSRATATAAIQERP